MYNLNESYVVLINRRCNQNPMIVSNVAACVQRGRQVVNTSAYAVSHLNNITLYSATVTSLAVNLPISLLIIFSINSSKYQIPRQ